MALTQVQDGMLGYDGGSFANRNRIINGDMRINQRGAGAITANASFIVDRFSLVNSSDGVPSAQQDSSAPAGFNNSVKYTITTADGTLTGTQRTGFAYRVEGLDVSDLGWGTASAQPITLSFWVRSSLTGTFGGSVANSAADRSYPFTYSITTADTWEKKSVTISGDTSGTWLTTNGIGIRLELSLGSGPDRSGTAGAWTGSFTTSATGAVSVIGTLNATWYITGVQLEAGSVATPFERRQFGQELALCQRYCYSQNKSITNNYYAFGVAFATSATSGQLGTPFPVSMRANPTATYSAANLFFVDSAVSSNAVFTAIVLDQYGNNYGYSNFTGGQGATSGNGGRWLANNAAAAWIIWSAEL
jgi:hypothetical protein